MGVSWSELFSASGGWELLIRHSMCMNDQYTFLATTLHLCWHGSRMGQTCSKFGRPQMPSYDSPWLLCWGERMLHCNFVSFGGMTCHGIQLHKFDCPFAVRKELQQDSGPNTLNGYLDAACVQVASFPDLSSNVYVALESILKSWTTGCLVWTKFLFNRHLSQSSNKASSTL